MNKLLFLLVLIVVNESNSKEVFLTSPNEISTANMRATMLRHFLKAAKSVSGGSHSDQDLQIVQTVVNRSRTLFEPLDNVTYVQMPSENITSVPVCNSSGSEHQRKDSFRLSKWMRSSVSPVEGRGQTTVDDRINLYEVFEKLAKLVEGLPVVIYCNLFVCRGKQQMSEEETEAKPGGEPEEGPDAEPEDEPEGEPEEEAEDEPMEESEEQEDAESVEED